MVTHRGWHGRYFEEFVPGDVFEHPLARTVTTTDNIWFTLLTQNTAPLHFDHEYAALTEFGKPLMNSAFTLALVAGQSVTDVSQNVFANLGWTEIKLPKPVFEGDTIRSRSTVVEVRDSGSRPTMGVLTVFTEGLNQRDELVISFTRTLLVYRAGHGPRYSSQEKTSAS